MSAGVTTRLCHPERSAKRVVEGPPTGFVPAPKSVILRTRHVLVRRYDAVMKSRFSFPHAAAGAGLALAIYELGWFVAGARGCHDLEWGLADMIFGSMLFAPFTVGAPILGWILGGYIAPEKRRIVTLLTCVVGLVAVVLIFALTTPTIGACRMDL
jgi:hypothetical protein